jgi:hypothetical protein
MEYKVTREQVQEAADTGVSQLVGLKAPPVFSELEDIDWEHETGGDLAFHGSTLEDLIANQNFNVFGKAARSIVRVTGHGDDDFNVNVTFKSSDPLEKSTQASKAEGQHHIDTMFIDEGFTLLCAVQPGRGDVLHSAGRGESATSDAFKALRYPRGAVLMSQRNFGSRITNKALGHTWHVGYRRNPGRLIIIDVSSSLLPNSVVPA